MSTESVGTINEAVAKIRLSIGPVRSAVYELVSLLATSPEEQGATDEEARIDGSFGVLQQASEMLRSGAAGLLGSVGKSFPEELNEQRKATLDIVDDLTRRAAKCMEANGDQTEAFRTLVEMAHSKLNPAIDTFLNGVAEFFDSELKKNAADDRDLIKSAMQEIDNISMSINLISLNASVEAARAGEAGRGFAVIAAEIQSLSSDSKKAVDSIRQRLT